MSQITPVIYELTGASRQSDAEVRASIDAAREQRQALKKVSTGEGSVSRTPNYPLRRAIAATALALGVGIASHVVEAAQPAIEAGGSHLIEAGDSVIDHVTGDPNVGPELPTEEQQQRMAETLENSSN